MKQTLLSLALCVAMPLSASASEPLADLSKKGEAANWRFFSDQVMGGQSTGQAVLDGGAVRLSGNVTTANNGGFIQIRRAVAPLPDNTKALTLRVKGDGQTYYIHVRTSATRLPWQYYQAAFQASHDWSDVSIPLSAFKPSGAILPGSLKPGSIRTVALVAYGRDHAADVSLASISAK